MTAPADHNPGERTDANLVEDFRGGDAGAFAILVRRHERRVYNLAYRMLGRAEDARDATQDTFVSCYRHLASFRGDAAFGTWLYRIATNASYDLLRKRAAEPLPLPEDYEPAGAPTGADPADTASTAVDVQRALMLVAVDFRTVLIMHDILEQPYEVVAAALEIPVGTVKSRLHRGRLALARALTGEPSTPSAPSKQENR